MFDDFYGFTGRPFQLTPDPAFYFESLSHRKAMSYLGYGLAQGEGFIVITGEVGAGKSTLVAHLMTTVDAARMRVAQIVTSKLDGEELIQVVARAFGLAVDVRDKPAALASIEHFLHEEARSGRRCLLVVDEAQNLALPALEELRMLSNFQLGAHPLLQVLLLGQPEFRTHLQCHPNLEQLRQRVIAAHHLEAMESGEVEPYVMHRLKCVGWKGNPVFDARVFGELYTATGGVPRRINQIVNRLLLLGAVERKERIDGVMLSQVLAELTADGALALGRPVEPAHHMVNPDHLLARRPAAAVAEVAVAAAPAQPTAVAETASTPAPWIEAAAAPAPAPAPAPAIEDALAKRDAQIAELQQAVLELSDSNEVHAAGSGGGQLAVDALHDRMAALESRLIEQERTIRHTLTMLIEWIERDEARRAA